MPSKTKTININEERLAYIRSKEKGCCLSPAEVVCLVSRMVFGYYWASACLALFIAFLALDIMGLFSRKNYLDVDGKVWHAGVRYKEQI